MERQRERRDGNQSNKIATLPCRKVINVIYYLYGVRKGLQYKVLMEFSFHESKKVSIASSLSFARFAVKNDFHWSSLILMQSRSIPFAIDKYTVVVCVLPSRLVVQAL